MTALFKKDKKAAPKKAAPKKAAIPAQLKVMRFNVKDGERYLTEIDADDFRHHVNGDVGLADLLVQH